MTEDDAITRFIAKLTASLADGSFVRIIFSQPVNRETSPARAMARLVELQGQPNLSVTMRHATRDVTKNIPAADAPAWVLEQLGGVFRSALLGTTRRDWQFVSSPDGGARLIDHKAATTHPPTRTHDRAKHDVLDASARDWLCGLGITDSAGKVRPAMAGKHRQIQRYVEILSHLSNECGWVQPSTPGPEGGVARELTLADMGCGKGYLTFGAWQWFHRQLRLPVRVIGIETRADLVATTNALAQKIGAATLVFSQGDIATAGLPRLDALIALHACNTATDDAIRRGIASGARLILVAPCCHKELRPQLAHPAALAPVLRHGVMEERMAEWLTDGLRALFLEWAGYRTKLMEFVSTEHTPKNILLAAIRERDPFTDLGARDRIVELKRFFGIGRHALDDLLAETAQKEPAASSG